MTGGQLKQILRDGGRVYGTMVALARNPRWVRVLAGVGLDYVIVDTEHSPFSRGEVADMLAAENGGVVGQPDRVVASRPRLTPEWQYGRTIHD